MAVFAAQLHLRHLLDESEEFFIAHAAANRTQSRGDVVTNCFSPAVAGRLARR